MKVMLINGLEMNQIKDGDVLRCLTDEEPPFNNLKLGDTIKVISSYQDGYVEVEFNEHTQLVWLGDLYLNFEHVNLV